MNGQEIGVAYSPDPQSGIQGTRLGKRHLQTRIPVQRRHGLRLRPPDEPAGCGVRPAPGPGRNDGLPPLINIGVGHDLSIRELAEAVAATVGYAGALEFYASKPAGTPRKRVNVNRLNAMGWKAKTDMREGCNRRTRIFWEKRLD